VISARGPSLTQVLTVDEVAIYLRVHASTIYRLVKKHQIPAFKVGGDWRFNRGSIDGWLAQAEAAARSKEQ
jgi:excisionase family DNA binding protein